MMVGLHVVETMPGDDSSEHKDRGDHQLRRGAAQPVAAEGDRDQEDRDGDRRSSTSHDGGERMQAVPALGPSAARP